MRTYRVKGQTFTSFLLPVQKQTVTAWPIDPFDLQCFKWWQKSYNRDTWLVAVNRCFWAFDVDSFFPTSFPFQIILMKLGKHFWFSHIDTSRLIYWINIYWTKRRCYNDAELVRIEGRWKLVWDNKHITIYRMGRQHNCNS